MEESSGMGRRRRQIPKYFRGGLSSLSIAVRLLKADDTKVVWFMVAPPEGLRLNIDQNEDDCCCFIHSHEDDIPNFYKQDDVDLNVAKVRTCNHQLPRTQCACIGSTVYFVGGDIDIDGDIQIINSEIIGKPITQRPNNYVPDNYFSNLNNLSHKIGLYDFDREREHIDNFPQMVLVSARYRPRLLTVGPKLFMFGGNLPPPPQNPSYYVPFAEVFDTTTGLCSPIKDPPFPCRIGFNTLFLAPFLSKVGEENILVMSRASSINPLPGYVSLYNVHTDSWETFFDADKILFRKTVSIHGSPVPVAYQDSIYWLRNSGNTACICSYDWKTKDFWEGPFIGLNHELPFLNSRESPMILLHIRLDLFILVWTEFLKIFAEDEEEDNSVSTSIHFTILRLSREDPPSHHLSAVVVGCFSYVLPGSAYRLLNGYCLPKERIMA